MSIRHAGTAIKEARKKNGLSREKFSDAVCSPQSLYRIEAGTAGVSPATFQALMTRAGVTCGILPMFADYIDFECFLSLKHIHLHIDAWQLDKAYEDLQKIKDMHWANNKYYYQEWLMHHCRLQFRSGHPDHKMLEQFLLTALHVSLAKVDFYEIKNMLLTNNEIEILILLAQEYLYLENRVLCLTICTQLLDYLNHTHISKQEKNQLNNMLSIVFIKYLIAASDYSTALKYALDSRKNIIFTKNSSCLLEITFLTGLCYYYNNFLSSAVDFIKTAIISANALKSNYATICIEYIKKNTSIDITENINSLSFLPCKVFRTPILIDQTELSDGTYDIFSSDVLSFGSLIHMLRAKQKISQNTLCIGLCSKSKLSKIENGTLQPDMLLAEALLQRLGISEREFCFWGNSQEAQIHELKFELINSYNLPDSRQQDLISQLQPYAQDKNPLIKQIYLYFSAILLKDSDSKISMLKDALSCTLPIFDINRILDYRLTWAELTILHSLALAYKPLDTNYIGINYLYHLDAYYKSINIDFLLRINTQTVMFKLMVYILYTSHRFSEAIDYFLTRPFHELLYTPTLYTSALFYTCQSFGECKKSEFAQEYGQSAYYLEKLNDFNDSAFILKKSLFEDFGINI